MPTPQQIRAELDADPLALGYAAPVAAGNDDATAAMINAKNYRGPVPIRELSASCLALGVTGGVLALVEIPIGSEISPGVPMTMATKAALHKILTLIQTDYRLETADCDDPSFASGCDGLIALGVIGAGDKAALMALGENRRSRAEVLWGDGATVTHGDIGRARKVVV